MRLVPRVSLATAMHIAILAATTALFISLRSMPLLSTLGFESANVLVTVFGPLFCLTAALNQRTKKSGYSQILLRELAWLLGNFLFVSLILFINGLYTTSCSSGAGWLPFITVGLPPLVVNVAFGVTIAAILYRPIIKILVFVVSYSLYALVIGLSWWHEPTFRVLTHASFLMTSDLLAGDELSGAVVGFRVATLMLALAIIVLGMNFFSAAETRVFDKKVRRPMVSGLLIGALLLGHFGLTYVSARSLGPSLNDLKHDYEILARNESFLIYGDPEKTSIQKAEDILFEASFYQSKIAKRLGHVRSTPIIIWLHDSNEEKYRYTGARNVHFALPKHREIHVTGYDVPHDVLGHELAHIYVGEQSRTIFGFPGKGYFIPNLAMTEGFAMLLSKELYVVHELTLIEQAQALYHANIRVDIEKLFSDNPIHFALMHPRAAYVYAGAALDFLLTQITEGERAEKLRLLINDADFAKLFSTEDAAKAHIASFMEKLKEPASERARRWAQRTFQQASILATDCSDQVATERLALERALLNHDTKQALAAINRLPKNNRAELLDMATDRMLIKKHYRSALDFLEARERIGSHDNVINAELSMKRVHSMIGLDRIADAKIILDALNDEYFFAPERRRIQALRIYAQAYLESPELKSLSAAGMAYLLAKTDQLESLPTFLFHLGKKAQSDTLHGPKVTWLSTYLFARYSTQVERNEEALHLVTTLLPEKDLVTNEMEHEVQLMFASLNQKLGHFVAALTAYQSLLNESANDAEKLLLNDRIDRVYSKMKTKEVTN